LSHFIIAGEYGKACGRAATNHTAVVIALTGKKKRRRPWTTC
jgi:hypothetical protein